MCAKRRRRLPLGQQGQSVAGQQREGDIARIVSGIGSWIPCGQGTIDFLCNRADFWRIRGKQSLKWLLLLRLAGWPWWWWCSVECSKSSRKQSAHSKEKRIPGTFELPGYIPIQFQSKIHILLLFAEFELNSVTPLRVGWLAIGGGRVRSVSGSFPVNIHRRAYCNPCPRLGVVVLWHWQSRAGLKVDAMRCGGGACKYVYARFVGGDGKRMSWSREGQQRRRMDWIVEEHWRSQLGGYIFVRILLNVNTKGWWHVVLVAEAYPLRGKVRKGGGDPKE